MTSEEQLTSKFQGNTNEGYISGEEIDDLGPVPLRTPNILHFLRQNQQPIVELLAVRVIIKPWNSGVLLTRSVMTEAARSSCETTRCCGDEFTDRSLPDGDLFRILGVVKKKRGTYIDSVPCRDSP